MKLEKLESGGALRVLLMISEKQRYVTELIKRHWNPDGIVSQDTLRNIRKNLGKDGLGLVTEMMEEGPRPKTFLVITEKGKLVAEKIKEIQEILEK